MTKTKARITGLILAIATAGSSVSTAQKVHTIGDSTMANYDEETTVTRGWAMYLQQFLDGILVNNRGKSGSSSKSFYEEAAFWKSVKQQMEPGDYVMIQFAHNDEKNGGADGDSLIAYYKKTGDEASAAKTDYRGTTPSGSYRQYLHRYIEETREKGCTPILVTPICRMFFSNGDIRRNGRHDLGDSFTQLTEEGIIIEKKVPADDHSMDYPYQMKQVAEETGVPVIDLTQATRELFAGYGETKCKELLSDGNGSTHLSTMGATLIARLCAREMEKQGILAEHINLPSDLSVSPAEADLGEAYKGQTIVKEFAISGFDLNPASGTVTIEGTDGLEVSADKQTWANRIEMSYNDATLISKFFARIILDKTGEISRNIAISSGDRTITVPVKATSVEITGGTEVKLYWRLEKDDTYTLEGPAEVLGESWSKMHVQRYSNPNKNTVWPEWTGFDATRKTQRNLIDGEEWPEGEIDEVSNRYIQFAVTAAKGTTLKIDSIGLFVCGCGGNGMMCHVNYSTEPYFADQHTIFAPKSMPANTMLEVSATPVISLTETDTLRLRIYPWYNGAATGKTICLSDVTIHGKAFSNKETGIAGTADTGNGPVATTLYDLSGRCVTDRHRGVIIRKDAYADGRQTTSKIINRQN